MPRVLLLAISLAASVATSAAYAAPAAAPAQVPAPALPGADVDALQQRLLASQQVIATLERQLAEEHNRAAALDQCRLRNGHLVSIGRQLVDGYARRYGEHKGHDPLQLARRRYEFELQALSGAIYDMKADIPLRSLPGGDAVAPPQTGAPQPAIPSRPAPDTAPPEPPKSAPGAAKTPTPKPATAG